MTIKSLRDSKTLDVQKVAVAIEADSGQAMPGLRESLTQAKAGRFGRTHTPEQIAARRPGRPVGSTKDRPKESVSIRLDPDLPVVLRATGDNWQSRVNQILRERFVL